MKIAILTWNYPPIKAGGTEIAAQNVARYLVKGGHEVAVITTWDPGLPKEGMEEDFRVFRVKSFKFKPLKYLIFCFNILLIIKKLKPDIIHAQAMWMGLPALISKTIFGEPYVIWVQGSDIYFPRFFKGPLQRLVLRNGNAVIALTKDMSREIKRVFNRDVFIIPNGIDIDEFQKLSKKGRSQKQIGSNGQNIIFVGSLVPVKGVRYLIDAMVHIQKECPRARLMIIGDGVERQNLERLKQKYGFSEQVTFIGRVSNEEIPRHLVAAEVFILPSLSEGFPLVLLEAMASGLPIVATRVRGIPEIIEEGINGYLANPGEPEELAEKIVKLLKHEELRQRISQNNMKKALDYSWPNIILQLEDVYHASMRQTEH